VPGRLAVQRKLCGLLVVHVSPRTPSAPGKARRKAFCRPAERPKTGQQNAAEIGIQNHQDSPRLFVTFRQAQSPVILRKAQEKGKPALVFPSSRTLSPFPSQKSYSAPRAARLRNAHLLSLFLFRPSYSRSFPRCLPR